MTYAQSIAMATSAQARDIRRMGKAVAAGQCILFLGAGVHAPPPEGSPFSYPEEARPPIGSTLSRLLAEECGFAEDFPHEDPGNLQRVGLAYEIDDSREGLVDEIVTAVSVGKTPSPMLRALARMSFPIVITTNYDHLFEQALREAGKEPRISVYKPNLDASAPEETTEHLDPTPDSPVVYKLHGDIDERGSLVVTDEDYIQFVLRMSDKKPYDPIPESLKVPLTTQKTLFIGYSLLDYNLRLLLKTLRRKIDPASRAKMYSIDYMPDPLIFDVWDRQTRYVEFIAEDVWSFVPQLHKAVFGEELAP